MNEIYAKEDCHVAKFKIRHEPKGIVLYKWIAETLSYLKFGKIFYRDCPMLLKRLTTAGNGAEFIGIYSPTGGLKNIYEWVGDNDDRNTIR